MSDVVSFERQQRLGYSESLNLDGVIVEILSWLPAKSLLRFRCVCKTWRALISDPYFIRKHLNCIDLKVTTSYSLLIRGLTSPSKVWEEDVIFRSAECEAVLKCLSHDDPLSTRRLHYPAIDRLSDFCRIGIYGSCNGLICLSFSHCSYVKRYPKFLTLMLWNPCTGKSQVLPQLPSWSPKEYFCGFGYDSKTSDYKVIVVGYKSGNEFAFVFTLKSGSWRNLERLNRYYIVHHLDGCLANEALYWVVGEAVEDRWFRASKILSFDLAEEKFHEIPLPFPPNAIKAPGMTVQVVSLNNCPTLSFHEPRGPYKMWVLKDYRVKESWAEVISIPSEVLDVDEDSYFTCISDNGEGLMRYNDDGSVALYNPMEKKFRRLNFGGGYWCENVMYIETFVSPLMGSTSATV